MNNKIIIKNAKENNLKSINLELPKNKLIVFTGLSGSGKSTLAFDTLYAEGQRRYIESLSSYARQFLDKIGKPDVEKIEGLTPAIAIDQKSGSKNPRSTVGTITEIYDYFRLLFARVGTQCCYICEKPITQMGISDIIEEILKLPVNSKVIILAPLIKDKKGSFTDLILSLKQKGYIRVMIDGAIIRIDEEIKLSKTKRHTIKVVIDRVIIKDENRERIISDIENALKLSYGEIELEILNHDEVGVDKKSIHYSEHLACFQDKISFEPLEPLSFSFNSPKGACTSCDGLGIRYSIDLSKIIDENLSIENGAIKVLYGFNKGYYLQLLKGFCKLRNINITIPFYELEDYQKKAIINGTIEDITFEWKETQMVKSWIGVTKIAYEMLKNEKDLVEYMSEKVCDICDGNRLKQESLWVKVANKTISDFIKMPIDECFEFFKNSKNFEYLSTQKQIIAKSILKEIKERLFFLHDVGLGYYH
jgi:excinuclease ABC subunit A